MNKKNLLLVAFTLFTTLTKSQTMPVVLPMRGGGEGTNAVRYVGGITAHGGEDIGEKINEAYASLPPTGGTIVVVADRNEDCYRFQTPIVAAMPGKYILLEGGSLTSQIATPPRPVCLNYAPVTASSALTFDYVVRGQGGFHIHGIRNLTLINNNCES